MNLVRPINDVHGTAMCPHGGQREIIADTCATKELNGSIDDGGVHLGNGDLDHGDLVLCRLLAQIINRPGGFKR